MKGLVKEIRRVSKQEALRASPPAQRYKVVSTEPLKLDSLHGEERLMEGDPDFDVARGIKVAAEVGDIALVITDRNGDHIASDLLLGRHGEGPDPGVIVAGAGLSFTGDILNVGEGFGISVAADDVAVDLDALAGPGLGNFGPSGLGINPGVGIDVDADGVSVDPTEISVSAFAPADADIDLNGHQVVNLSAPVSLTSASRVRDVLDATEARRIRTFSASGDYELGDMVSLAANIAECAAPLANQHSPRYLSPSKRYENDFPNPNGAEHILGWWGSLGSLGVFDRSDITVTRITNDGYGTSTCLEVSGDPGVGGLAGAGIAMGCDTAGRYILALSENDLLYARMAIKVQAGALAAGAFSHLTVSYINAAGGTITSKVLDEVPGAVVGEWTVVEGVGIAPAGTVKAYVRAAVYGLAANPSTVRVAMGQAVINSTQGVPRDDFSEVRVEDVAMPGADTVLIDWTRCTGGQEYSAIVKGFADSGMGEVDLEFRDTTNTDITPAEFTTEVADATGEFEMACTKVAPRTAREARVIATGGWEGVAIDARLDADTGRPLSKPFLRGFNDFTFVAGPYGFDLGIPQRVSIGATTIRVVLLPDDAQPSAGAAIDWSRSWLAGRADQLRAAGIKLIAGVGGSPGWMGTHYAATTMTGAYSVVMTNAFGQAVANIPLTSAAGWPASGYVLATPAVGKTLYFAYSGITGNTLTGVTLLFPPDGEEFTTVNFLAGQAVYQLPSASYLSGADRDHVGDIFASLAASPYADLIAGYEISNEPNYDVDWLPAANATDYMDFASRVYTKIKAADSEAQVGIGVLAQWHNTFAGYTSNEAFLTTMYAHGAHDHSDAIVFHPYPDAYTTAPNVAGTTGWWLHFNTLQAIMAAHGDAAKPIWITEYGWPMVSVPAEELRQARWLAMLNHLVRRRPNVQVACLHVLVNPSTAGDNNGQDFAISTFDGVKAVPREAFNAFQADWTRQWWQPKAVGLHRNVFRGDVNIIDQRQPDVSALRIRGRTSSTKPLLEILGRNAEAISLRSGDSTYSTRLTLGRIAEEAKLVLAGGTGLAGAGTTAGDIGLWNLNTAGKIALTIGGFLPRVVVSNAGVTIGFPDADTGTGWVLSGNGTNYATLKNTAAADFALAQNPTGTTQVSAGSSLGLASGGSMYTLTKANAVNELAFYGGALGTTLRGEVGSGGMILFDNASSQSLLDLSWLASTSRVAGIGAGGGIGDKVLLWGGGSSAFGLGVQSARLVAFLGATSSKFAVRASNSSGASSSGSDAVTLGGDGTIASAVAVTGGVAYSALQVAADAVLQNKLLSADTQPAFRVKGDGKHEWGPGGSTAIDTNLYRLAAGVLKTDGYIEALGGIISGLGASTQIYLNSLTGSVVFGSALDAQLDRAAASKLNTPGDMTFRGSAGLFVGDVGWGGTALYGIGHASIVSTTGYGFLQGNLGDTFINAASGRTLALRVNNVSVVSVLGTSVSIVQPTTFTVANAAPVVIRSGATGSFSYLDMGRAAGEFLVGQAAAINNFTVGTAAGDTVIRQLAGGLWIGVGTNAEEIRLQDGKIGVFGVAPVARAAAITQTYATATRTHANPTAAAVAVTAATLAGYGYTQAQADSIPVAINALVADVANIKQVLNSVIDDLQAYGWEQ